MNLPDLHRTSDLPAQADADADLRARRRVLTVLAVAPAFAACAFGTADLPPGNQDPDYDGAADPTENPTDDTGPTDEDTGASPAPDSGGATTPPKDSGTAPQDTGAVAKDSGTPPADTGTATCAGTLAGAVSGWAVGTFKKVGNSFVGRDTSGFWAVRSICTHNNSCSLKTPTTSGISCPCHGAGFTVDGKVTKGPAVTSLANYQVTICNGNVYVNTSKTVTMGTRASA
jgi:Rieske Fe-S protein